MSWLYTSKDCASRFLVAGLGAACLDPSFRLTSASCSSASERLLLSSITVDLHMESNLLISFESFGDLITFRPRNAEIVYHVFICMPARFMSSDRMPSTFNLLARDVAIFLVTPSWLLPYGQVIHYHRLGNTQDHWLILVQLFGQLVMFYCTALQILALSRRLSAHGLALMRPQPLTLSSPGEAASLPVSRCVSVSGCVPVTCSLLTLDSSSEQSSNASIVVLSRSFQAIQLGC